MQSSCIQRRVRAVLVGGLLVGYTAYLGSFFSQRDSQQIQAVSKSILFGKSSPFQTLDLREDDSNATVATILPAPVSLEEPMPVGPQVLDGPMIHTVAAGETLTTIWSKLGASREGGVKAAEAFRAAKISCSFLKAGETLKLLRKGGDIVSLERKLSEGGTLKLIGSSESGYSSSVEAATVREQERTISGLVHTSFSASASDAGLPFSLVDEFVDLFSSRVEFQRDFQPGDTFSLVYIHRESSDGQVLKPGVIKAASMRLGSKFFASVRHEERGVTPRYYDERGQVPGNFFLRYPLQFTRISSTFSTARFHPILNRSRAHNGVDFAAPTGTPVRSIGSGTVIFSGYTNSTGYMVRIRHSEKYTTEYMHLSRISENIKENSRVERGQLIGAVGSTGLSTGSHLHFGLFDNGDYTDPMKAKLPEISNGGAVPQLVLAAIKKLEQQHQILALNRDVQGTKRHA